MIDLLKTIMKGFRIFAREGLIGVEYRLKLLQSDQCIRDMAASNRLSFRFLKKLRGFTYLPMRIIKRWTRNESGEHLSRGRCLQGSQSYKSWVLLEQKRLEGAYGDIKRIIDVMPNKPAFTIVVDTRPGIDGLDETIHSIRNQFYPDWDIRVLMDPDSDTSTSLSNDIKTLKDLSLSDIRGDFLVFLQSGQRLTVNALYEFAAVINRVPDTDLVYGDQDFYSASGNREDPFYKPGWSPDYLESFNYIGFPACFRTIIAQGCFDQAHFYDFVLRFTERTIKVFHISKIIGHEVKKFYVLEAPADKMVTRDIAALTGRLSRTGRRGIARPHESYQGCYKIELELTHFPLVSIVIPTAGKTIKIGNRQIDLIQNVILQIRRLSTYKNIEIIVVDNGNLTTDQIDLLAKNKCKRITYTNPVFNISKKLNLGVSIATGELLLLMNDDIEIRTHSWVERMIEHFEKPHVGVVGAKLLYPDEQTQHVGIALNLGIPDHVRRYYHKNDPGYFFSTCGVRNYSAVTGACMMTRANLYREVGGYSEELAVSYNDVDYCLKIQQKGFWVVYAPAVELTHMESVSREQPTIVSEVIWFKKRWRAKTIFDQFYNEQFLAVKPPTFVPRINQRIV